MWFYFFNSFFFFVAMRFFGFVVILICVVEIVFVIRPIVMNFLFPGFDWHYNCKRSLLQEELIHFKPLLWGFRFLCYSMSLSISFCMDVVWCVCMHLYFVTVCVSLFIICVNMAFPFCSTLLLMSQFPFLTLSFLN